VTVEAEAAIDHLLFTLIEDIEQIADLLPEILVAKHFIVIHGLLVSDDITEGS
jgi:hypothetical protein